MQRNNRANDCWGADKMIAESVLALWGMLCCSVAYIVFMVRVS